VNESELLGNILSNFSKVKIVNNDNDFEVIPEIFYLLTAYFEHYPEHVKREGLFRVNGERAKIKELDIHLA
jgi:hypothetical protein